MKSPNTQYAYDNPVAGREYKGIPMFAARGVHEAVAAQLQEYVPAGSRVLELGCGAGALTQRLLDLGYLVTPVDIEPARNRADSVPIKQDLNAPRWNVIEEVSGIEHFDAIVAIEVIEHVENPAHFVRTASALLEGGGVMVISTPNVASAYSALVLLSRRNLFCFNKSLIHSTGHISVVPPWILRHFLDESGFRIRRHLAVGSHEGGLVHTIGERALRLVMRVMSRPQEDETLNDGIITLITASKQ